MRDDKQYVKINLYKRLPKFEKYDTINESKKLKLFSNFYLPIELEIFEYQEVNTIKREYTNQELKEKIISKLENELNDEIGSKNIENIQINEKDIDGGLEIEVIYEVIEKIGINKKIEEEHQELTSNE